MTNQTENKRIYFEKSVKALFTLEDIANDNLARLIANNYEYYLDLALKQRTESLIEEIAEMIYANERAAGEVCGLSEGTQGCDDANFYQAMGKEFQQVATFIKSKYLKQEEKGK